jgi:hypothetical protein
MENLGEDTSQRMVELIVEAIKVGREAGASPSDIEDLIHMAAAMHLWEQEARAA